MTLDRQAVQVALVGAGHAHLHLVRQSAMLRQAGVELTLVAPWRFHYSGLATGVLSGDVPPGAAMIDVEALAHASGVSYRPGTVVGIERTDRRLILDTGERLASDAASFNIGSVTTEPDGSPPKSPPWRVKPLVQLLGLREALTAAAGTDSTAPAVVIVGGGQSGFEVAAAVTGLMERLGLRPQPDPRPSGDRRRRCADCASPWPSEA